MRSPRAWILLAASVTGLVLCAPPVAAAPAEVGLSARSRSQIEALAEAKARRTPGQAKIDSSLLTAAQLSRGRSLPAGVRLRSTVPTDPNGRTRVAVRGDITPALLGRVRDLGGVVRSSRPKDGVVSADVPLDQVAKLGEVPAVRHVSSLATSWTTSGLTPPTAPVSKQERGRQLDARVRSALRQQSVRRSVGTAASSIVSEGDKVLGADRARKARKLSGLGVTVGVLSDGVDSLAASVIAGELPSGVKVIAPGEGDEGTAMLEIVHDLAPKAKLAFATANDTPADFAAHIRALRAAGADIIVDDVLYYGESPFQDGPIAQAVTDVTRDGALYFSSAGNEGNLDDKTSGNYEAAFRSSGRVIGKYAGTAHDFDPTSRVQTVDPTGISNGPTILQWADPLGAAGDDYDLYVLDTDGDVIGFSNDVQNGDDDPFEGVGLDESGPFRLAVVKFKGADRYFQLSDFGGRFKADGSVKAYASPGAIRGHATVPAAFSVAAAPAHGGLPFDLEPGDPAQPKGPFPSRYSRTQKSERFTSDGPRRMFFRANGTPVTPGNFTATGGEVRIDPDLTAPDGVRTSVPGFEEFFGTSASAPHAAAVAALAVSGKPGLTAAAFRSSLAVALDIEGKGQDRDTGRGIVMAEPVLKRIGSKGQPYVESGAPIVTSTTDGDRFIEPGEQADVSIPATNAGGAEAKSVVVSLRSTTPGVTLTPAGAAYGTIAAGARRARTFRLTVPANRPLGSEVVLVSKVSFQGAFSPQTGTGSIAVGEPSATTTNFAYRGRPVPIPDADPEGVSVPIKVTGVGLVSRVTFSIDGTTCSTTEGSTTVGIDHTYARDLVGVLTSPGGTRVALFERVGELGRNFCQTVFDDSAGQSIQLALGSQAPYTGRWKPAEPLVGFRGHGGDGTWTFNVSDNAGVDTGTLRAFSLHLNGYVGRTR